MGRSVVRTLVDRAGNRAQRRGLSYDVGNVGARTLDRSLGLQETGDVEDDEVVARLALE